MVLIVEPLEQVAPTPVFMDFIENPQIDARELSFKNAFPMLGDIPVQVALVQLPKNRFGQRG